MAVTGAEIKIGVDILSRIFKSFKGVLQTRNEKNILSKIYKELLLGNQGDLDKVEAFLLQLEKLGSSSPDFVKAKGYFRRAKIAITPTPTGRFVVKKKKLTTKTKRLERKKLSRKGLR